MRKKMNLAVEVWELLSRDRKLWLLPLALAMLVIGGLLVYAQTSVLAPFLYTLF